MTALKTFSILIIQIHLFLGLTSFAFAQNFDQTAYSLEIKDSNTKAGQIVIQKNGEYFLSKNDYDPGIYGVIVKDPALSLNQITQTSSYVVINGQVEVLVTKKNGDIKEGDLITTSKELGIGQKATKSGHVLGKALKSFPDSSDKSEQGVIPVLINVSYNQVSAKSESLTKAGLDQVASKVSSALITGDLPNLLKYVFALLLGIISFFVGLYHFVKSNRTAVESIARNPMAKADIQKQLIVGTAGIVIVSAIGVVIAVWILFVL